MQMNEDRLNDLEKQQSNDQSQSKRKRRKRTDDEGRTYKCHCGKSYLSYPALYTHIKTKHADQPLARMSRTYQPNQQSPASRPQRPTPIPKSPIKSQPHPQQPPKSPTLPKQLQQNYPLYGNSLPQVNNIETIREFLFKYFPNIVVNTAQSYKNDMTITDKKELKEMKDYWGGRKKEDERFGEFYQTPVRYVVGKFVAELEQDVQNWSFRRFVFFFVFTLKRALEKIKGEGYFREHHAGELPAMMDEIMREHFLQDPNDFLSNPTVAAKMLYHFARWLYVNKFTNLSLKYNF